MTSLLERPAAKPAQPVAYPTVFRRGHQFEIALGQRLALGGFKGPNDVAFGPDGWLYVLNRYPTEGLLARNRWVRVNLNDDGYENDIVPLGPDGKVMDFGEEGVGALVAVPRSAMETRRESEYKALIEKLIATLGDESDQDREEYRRTLDTYARSFESSQGP